jgi:hypothetical protein
MTGAEIRKTPDPDRKLHELYGRAKALFDLVAPQEFKKGGDWDTDFLTAFSKDS